MTQHQEQQVAQPQPPAATALRLDQVAHGREGQGRWLAPLQQVQQGRRRGADRAEQGERLEELLMPMMGGALVSAPMVVEGSDELTLSPERKTFINYWLRHVWEYVMPTYPAFIVACGLIGIPAVRFAQLNFPLTIAAILSGICVGFWGVSRSSKPRHEISSVTYRRLIKNLSPFMVSLILVIGFKVELVIGFVLTILGMIFLYRIDKSVIQKSLKDSVSIGLLLAVMVIMGFKKILESSQAVIGLSTYLSSSGIPAWMIAILIPLSAHRGKSCGRPPRGTSTSW